LNFQHSCQSLMDEAVHYWQLFLLDQTHYVHPPPRTGTAPDSEPCSVWNVTLYIKSRRPAILIVFNLHDSLYNRLSYRYGKKSYQLRGSQSGVAEYSHLLVRTNMLLDI
jgi:hypothetical protein